IEKSLDWGKQRPAGINGRRGLQNDGHWRRVTVTADNPAHTLLLSVSNVQTQPGRTTFDAYLVGPVDVKFEQQIWKGGLRLYSGEARARLRSKLALKCESTARTEPTGGLLPDVVFRMRALSADLSYDNVVVEHTAGVGGDAAKVLGEGMLNFLKQVKPSLERDLLEKANAAIVKAADTKEVRIGLGKLLAGKK